MPRDEIGARDAVAIEEDAEAASASADAAIANFAAAKSAVFMPHPLDRDREPAGPGFNGTGGGGPRAIVGDNNLEIAVGLMCESAQHGVQRIRPFVSCHHHGDKIGADCGRGSATGEPGFHISVVGALRVGDRKQKPFGSVEQAQPQKIAAEKRP